MMAALLSSSESTVVGVSRNRQANTPLSMTSGCFVTSIKCVVLGGYLDCHSRGGGGCRANQVKIFLSRQILKDIVTVYSL